MSVLQVMEIGVLCRATRQARILMERLSGDRIELLSPARKATSDHFINLLYFR
ncbi:hypothetical protein [Rhizobium sp. NFR03]|uniref:hypothetical protein n=1 Tax=Rhizobium sp. NFR03 TaxID=1566263 RepID=UPI000A828979|nr:hypothetical protein [Rhizobium sp. NFR03]